MSLTTPEKYKNPFAERDDSAGLSNEDIKKLIELPQIYEDKLVSFKNLILEGKKGSGKAIQFKRIIIQTESERSTLKTICVFVLLHGTFPESMTILRKKLDFLSQFLSSVFNGWWFASDIQDRSTKAAWTKETLAR